MRFYRFRWMDRNRSIPYSFQLKLPFVSLFQAGAPWHLPLAFLGGVSAEMSACVTTARPEKRQMENWNADYCDSRLMAIGVLKRPIMSTQYSPEPEAGVDLRHPPVWKQLCLAASLEVDPGRLPERIEEARYAILDRIEERFPTKSTDEEQVELRVALEALSSPRATQAWRDLAHLSTGR